MTNYRFETNYWDDKSKKLAGIHFINFIHKLDLSLWDKLGYWDNNYRPFSLFHHDKIISHVCLYTMDMIVKGKRCSVAQISAVGTHPDYRRQGLNFQLTQKVLEWATPKHDFYFLFADDIALPFYKHCGFRTVDEHKTIITLKNHNYDKREGAVKLDINKESDRDLIYKMALKRDAVSNQLGIFTPKLFMFWCLYDLGDNIYHIPELDALVIYQRQGNTVVVQDIVASKIPAFDQFYPFIAENKDQEVAFKFMTDKMKIESYSAQEIKINNGTHLMGSFPFENRPFLFPLTAHA